MATDSQMPSDSGSVRKLQMLENIVRCSPAIVDEDARDTFLILIWLTLVDLGALQTAGKAA